ncbi:MAG: hypothetical protein IT198_08120 [Acidimicrobiia bacterium]|nr:hypothetical protein [Acidimicrobiia bacterium]
MRSTRPRSWSLRIVPLALGIAAVLIVACGESTTSSTPTTKGAAEGDEASTLTIDAADFTFDLPETFTPGWTTITLENSGEEPHQANILKMNDGVTKEQIEAALADETGAALLSLVTPVGGPNNVVSGESQSVVVNLTEGDYVLLCFTAGSDGVPHIAKGMVGYMTVTGEKRDTEPPASDGTITMSDFEFELPHDFAGKGTFEVKNDGPQVHELTLVKLESGKTMQDVEAFLGTPPGTAPSGPPPFTDAGGISAMAADETAYVDLDLDSGDYVAICFVPDSTSGQPHFAEGMIHEFTVE